MKNSHTATQIGAIIFSLASLTTLVVNADIKVTMGQISDSRSSEKMMSSLNLQLLLSGEKLSQMKGIKVEVAKATDDTGRDLLAGRQKGFDEGKFTELKKPFGMGQKKEDEREVSLRLSNPQRAAKSVSLSGSFELLDPAADPASSFTVNPGEHLNKELDHPALKEAKVKIVFKSMKDNEVQYTLTDSSGKLASIEICDESGKPLDTNGSGNFGFGGSKTCTIYFEKLPEKVQAKIQLSTAKAVVVVPWKLEQVALP